MRQLVWGGVQLQFMGEALMDKTIQQQRAYYALQAVKQDLVKTQNEYNKADKIKASEYKAYAAKMPAMIHTNGLGQTVAFYRSKGNSNTAYQALYDLLESWLCQKNIKDLPSSPIQVYDGDDLLLEMTQNDMRSYMLAQEESLIFMDWVKKFAVTLMGDD